MAEDIKLLLNKLVSITELLTVETADLLRDLTDRYPADYRVGMLERVDALREAGLQLRTIADTSLGKTDLQNEVQA